MTIHRVHLGLGEPARHYFRDPELSEMARIAMLLDAEMTGQMSTVGGNYALQVIFGQAVAGLITARNVYLALTTADPTANPASLAVALANEISASGYARQQVATTAPSGSPAALSNSAQITFGPFNAAPGTITYAALCSVLSGTTGDFLYKWQLTDASNNATPKTPGVNDSLIVSVGSLTANDS